MSLIEEYGERKEEKGRKKGLEIGLKEGLKEGRKKGTENIIKNILISGLNPKEIAEITKVPLPVINEIKVKYNL